MVFEDVSDENAFAPDTPDGNAPANPDVRSYQISGLKGPIPIVGYFFGFSQASLARLCTARIHEATRILRRAPTNTEAQALCEVADKEMRISSVGPITGAVAGAWRCRATMDAWKARLAKKKDFNPEVFKVGPMELARGEAAKRMRLGIRYLNWVVLSLIAGNILISAYAVSVSTVGLMRDKRLKEYSQARTQYIRNEMAEQKKQRGERQNGRRSDGVLSQMGTKQGGAPVKSPPEWDEASPTGGDFSEEPSYQATSSRDQGPSSTSAGSTQVYQQSPSTPRSQSQQQASEPESTGSFYDDYEDASPSAQSPSSRSSGSSGSSRGGAWDRIRRGGANAPLQKPSAQERASDDNGSYSEKDAERQYARSEAQKEFDDKIERERKGGDFGGAGGGRW